ncbi:hypothetical protein [Actinokineospora enzanensis]|uniref:hypothetical protein n=1 Tax=Actinokineospora enzanensis TaxID=155975 RepID=UPI0003816AE6|nr:hypothetical protein [Actinokineospora enzanensis]
MNDAHDPAITRPGEMLVHLDDAPRYPATLGTPWHYATSFDRKARLAQDHFAAVPLFRKEVAEQVAIWLNTTSGDSRDATRAEWHGDALVLVEGSYEHTDGYRPEVIRPDEHGRYQLAPGWLWVEEDPDDVIAELDESTVTALRILARDGDRLTPDERRALLGYAAGGPDADDESLARAEHAADALEQQHAASAAGNHAPIRCRDCGGTYPGLEGDSPEGQVRYCTELPTRLADFVPFFDVDEPFPQEHHRFLSDETCGELCHCAPTTPEAEYLLGTGHRTEQIEELLATQGKTVEMCGPCNTLIFASNDEEKTRFWAEHPDCQWDYHKD